MAQHEVRTRRGAIGPRSAGFEVVVLERRGIDLTIVSLRRPYDEITHPVHREIRAPLLYLPEYLIDAPLRP